MPPTMKPALGQSSLKEMWGGKKKQKEPKIEQKEEEAIEGEAAMDVDTVKVFKGTRNLPWKACVSRFEPKTAESSKRKETPATEEHLSDQVRIKKRRILTSDDESDAVVNGAEPGTKSLPATSPAPSSPTSPSTSQAKSSPRSPSTSQGKASPKPKSKGKAKAADVVKTSRTGDEDAAAAASSGDEGDDGENEIDGVDSEDELVVSDGHVASKCAEAALSKKDDVDMKGGWKVGAPVPYAALTKTFAHIEATTKRLEKTAFLTCLLLLIIQRSAKGESESLLQAVYLCINRLSPDYIGIELGIGESLLIKAIGESTGRSNAVIKADLQKEGDLGLVAMNSKNSQKTLFKPKPLTIPFVFKNLKDIALTTGNSSQAKKVSIITKLLAACQDFEAKYIIRSLEGKLRIGNAERSVLVAVAHAAVLAERERSNKKWSQEKLAARLEEGADIIKGVYSELPSYDEVIPALLKYGIDGIREHCKLTPGVPLKPMLAKPTKAIGEVLDRFENKRFTCEYKYDGERAQVHKLADGSVAVFSRNSEDMSKKYPDLVEQLPKCIKDSTKSFVLDAEAVAIDRTTGKLMPFQELSRRKRKDPLLQKSLFERRQLLREHFNIVLGEFDFAKSSDSETTEEIQAFLEESVKDGCEGLMVKMLDSDLKKDYLAGVGDSLDLVVVGGYYGKGKRTNVYGAFLLACYDGDSEEYQTICKIGTGFSEEALQSHYKTLKPLELSKVRGDVKVGGAKPDIWFEPQVVWEVLTADLSLSPVYTAAQGLVNLLWLFTTSQKLTMEFKVEDRGISLRFPRFIRIRDDKAADDATGPEQVNILKTLRAGPVLN
ncbi:hypothetical protein DXG03_007005 [Asterophora parasitica]|uniref:DNA ligase n=1 Tax=Asterophora parasitica TaxID=117018 RepID=A0A9P7KHQ2_9AGAR|nr:hypothetical protein DXG03_007005 [Asterophora parasitica]